MAPFIGTRISEVCFAPPECACAHEVAGSIWWWIHRIITVHSSWLAFVNDCFLLPSSGCDLIGQDYKYQVGQYKCVDTIKKPALVTTYHAPLFVYSETMQRPPLFRDHLYSSIQRPPLFRDHLVMSNNLYTMLFLGCCFLSVCCHVVMLAVVMLVCVNVDMHKHLLYVHACCCHVAVVMLSCLLLSCCHACCCHMLSCLLLTCLLLFSISLFVTSLVRARHMEPSKQET